MKILVLTQYFPPEFGAAAARNSEHAQIWAEAGHEVEILTGMPNYPAGVILPAYRGKGFLRERRDGYTVTRTWIFATPNRSVAKRVLASLSFMASALITGLFRCQRPDVIIASSGPFFVGPLGYLLSLFRRAPFVFEVRDLLPQQAIDVGMIRNPVIIRVLKGIEAFLYRRACRVVAVAEASRQALIARGLPEEKVRTIENGILEDFYQPGEKENDIRREQGWEGKFVALYVGAHGVSQGLATLLDVADKLRDIKGLEVVMVGEGAHKPALVAEAEARQLANVTFLPLQDKVRMPGFYAAADCCFVPLRKGTYFTINIPSKLFEIMACARPVLLGAEGQARALVEEAGAGIAVSPEDAQAFADAVRQLHENPDQAQALGTAGRDYVVRRHTRRAKAGIYLEMLAEVRRP